LRIDLENTRVVFRRWKRDQVNVDGVGIAASDTARDYHRQAQCAKRADDLATHR
jgi:hypothetical protein